MRVEDAARATVGVAGWSVRPQGDASASSPDGPSGPAEGADRDAAYVTNLERLAALLIDDTDLDRTLELVLQATAETIPGTAAASVSVRHGTGYVTVGSSDDTVVGLDHLQYRLREGPCVAAVEQGELQQVDDLLTETRWPRFRKEAASAACRSLLATPLRAHDETIGALNVFAARPHAFDARAAELALRIAVPAAAALVNLQAFQRATDLAAQLEEAMASRSVIEQAKGIVIARQRCSPEAAFEVLRRISQQTNRKVRDVAREVVERHGGVPGRGDDVGR